MQAQRSFNSGLLKEKSVNSDTIVSQSSKNGITSIYVDAHTLKDYLLLQRRALLQSVAADEKLVSEMDTILNQIETFVNQQVTLTASDSAAISINGIQVNHTMMLDILKKCIIMIKKNADERRKAYLQIVRDTEKRYEIVNNKKRGRFNRKGL